MNFLLICHISDVETFHSSQYMLMFSQLLLCNYFNKFLVFFFVAVKIILSYHNYLNNSILFYLIIEKKRLNKTLTGHHKYTQMNTQKHRGFILFYFQRMHI